MGDVSGPGYSEVNDTRTGAETDGAETAGAGIIDDNGPEGAEGKIDIMTPKKTNKTPILI